MVIFASANPSLIAFSTSLLASASLVNVLPVGIVRLTVLTPLVCASCAISAASEPVTSFLTLPSRYVTLALVTPLSATVLISNVTPSKFRIPSYVPSTELTGLYFFSPSTVPSAPLATMLYVVLSY